MLFLLVMLYMPILFDYIFYLPVSDSKFMFFLQPLTYLLAIKGFSGFVTGRPFPIGALTKSKNSFSGQLE